MAAFELLVEAHRPTLKAILRRVVTLLTEQGARYVISGAVALSLYIRPRMTIDIDVLVERHQRAEIDKLFSAKFEVRSLDHFQSRFGEGGVTIDVRYAHTEAEEFALANGIDATILGTSVRAASPEALVWLYLFSDYAQNFVDGLLIIRDGRIADVEAMRNRIHQADPGLIPKLQEMVEAASRPVLSYEESRARRK